MILDYKYIKKQGKLSVSYTDNVGMKRIIDFDVDKFKSYYKTPTGRFLNWDGSRCDEKLTSDPSKFDLRVFFEELDPKYKKLFAERTSPLLYAFDIETKLRPDREFTEPSSADMPVHTISVVSPTLDSMVMGDKQMTESEIAWVNDQINKFLDELEFFHKLKLPFPKFRYNYFASEHDMIDYFLKGVVSKVPVLTGWNCIRYDWQYLTNRVKNYFPDISMASASRIWQCTQKRCTDMKGQDFYVPLPVHTPIIDMMDVMDFDLAVMPIKESNGLDYIASETPGLGAHKIDYEGDLEELYETDYPRYVFYNAIDSILVQLINYRYKTMDTMYMQALYCKCKIQDPFSKIAVSEWLTWDDYNEQGYKVVYERNEDPDRGFLQGAYVAQPIPGKWDFITCNDFASLYPSTIITCNISYDNFVGAFYDEEKLEQYRNKPEEYVVVGGNVHRYNADKNANKHHVGEFLFSCLNDKALQPYREDPNYFVSVNGHVYKNDKDYSFKRIQAKLKATRNVSKYLGKQLDAKVMLDVEHILKGRQPSTDPYADNLVQAMKEMGYEIHDSSDLTNNMTRDELTEFKRKLGVEITFYTCKEQAMKLLGNSMYGGSSHIAFYWFKMELARDITGEARNLIHKMEDHLPKYWDENWASMDEWHKKWGIAVDKDKVKKIIANGDHMITRVYGDTDSLYISYAKLLSTIKGFDNMSQREKLDIIVHINTDFLNDHNKAYMEKYYEGRNVKSIHDFELETVALSGLWLNVKKRYCQILLWKDGKYFDDDSLPIKAKGLEMIKASYPKYVREGLKRVVRRILESNGTDNLWDKTNAFVQQERMGFYKANIEDVCANMGVNGYTKYILSKEDADDNPRAQITPLDTRGTVLYTMPKCPANVRGVGNYNAIRKAHGLPGEPIYGGKVKLYLFVPYKHADRKAKVVHQPFAFQSKRYPKWADKYAPIDRGAMFEKYFLDPLNRICKDSMQFAPFKLDGSKEMPGLFDGMW